MKTCLLAFGFALLPTAGAIQAEQMPSITMDIASPPPEFFSSHELEMVLPAEVSAVHFRLLPHSPAVRQILIKDAERGILLPPSGGKVPLGNGVGYTLYNPHYDLELAK